MARLIDFLLSIMIKLEEVSRRVVIVIGFARMARDFPESLKDEDR